LILTIAGAATALPTGDTGLMQFGGTCQETDAIGLAAPDVK